MRSPSPPRPTPRPTTPPPLRRRSRPSPPAASPAPTPATFTQTFDTANVGTAKTLTPAGTVADGNGGANYTITFVNDTTGVITARAVTVTATTDTKVYDSTTSSAAVPTVTAGGLAGTDTGSFTQTFDTANVGTGKTLTPAGSITDGNGGANYAITFANDTTGVITARADHRDRHDRHQGLRRHHQLGGDPDHHVGHARRHRHRRVHPDLRHRQRRAPARRSPRPGRSATATVARTTPSPSSTTPPVSITGRAVTVTADSGQAKIYGTPDPTLTYTVTSGSLQPGDSFTGALARTAGENVGTTAINQGTARPRARTTRSPSCPRTSPSSPAPITVTAATDTKVYDATTASAAIPTVTTGSLAGTDTGVVHPDLRHQERRHRQDTHPGRHGHRRQRRRQLHHHLRQRHHRGHHRPRRHRLRDD